MSDRGRAQYGPGHVPRGGNTVTVVERVQDPIAFTQAKAPPHSVEAEESVLGAVAPVAEGRG